MMAIGTSKDHYRVPGERTWKWVDLWNDPCTPDMAIYDMMQGLQSPIGTHYVGCAYNLAGFLLVAGEKVHSGLSGAYDAVKKRVISLIKTAIGYKELICIWVILDRNTSYLIKGNVPCIKFCIRVKENTKQMKEYKTDKTVLYIPTCIDYKIFDLLRVKENTKQNKTKREITILVQVHNLSLMWMVAYNLCWLKGLYDFLLNLRLRWLLSSLKIRTSLKM